MANTVKCDLWVDGGIFNDNQNLYPREELLKLAGRYVAWSLDGTRILADGVDHCEVDQKLIAAGLDPQRVVHSYVDGMNG